MNQEQAVKEYQCAGCTNGSYEDCYKKGEYGVECCSHEPGTFMAIVGTLFLGMPKGFNRLGQCKNTYINIFEKFDDGWGYDKFNVPVWKHKDTHGNILVRGISPRTNTPFIHVFLEDCLDKIDCLEITSEDIDKMD
jgi:hypothetical protein